MTYEIYMTVGDENQNTSWVLATNIEDLTDTEMMTKNTVDDEGIVLDYRLTERYRKFL